MVFFIMTLATMSSLALLILEKIWKGAEGGLVSMAASSGVMRDHPRMGQIQRMGHTVTSAFMKGGDLMVHDLRLS